MPAYSTLSFFVILNQNLITDYNELLRSMFDHLLTNNEFDKEIRNLLVYKKALCLTQILKMNQNYWKK